MKHLAFVAWAAGCVAYLALIPAINSRFALDHAKQMRLEQNRAVLKQAEIEAGQVTGVCSWNGKKLPLAEAWAALQERNRK